MKTIECPNCGGKIKKHEGEYLFCPYCGSELDIYDNRIKIDKRVHIIKEDIAAIKEADNHNLIEQNRHKEMLLNRGRFFWQTLWEGMEDENRSTTVLTILVFSLIIVFFVASFGYSAITDIVEKRQHQAAIKEGLITAGSYYDYEGMNYDAAESILRLKGFTNISFVDLNDASIFKKGYKEDTVASISIAGDSHFYADTFFKPDDIIIIQYH